MAPSHAHERKSRRAAADCRSDRRLSRKGLRVEAIQLSEGVALATGRGAERSGLSGPVRGELVAVKLGEVVCREDQSRLVRTADLPRRWDRLM
jgi:hypothetical protein